MGRLATFISTLKRLISRRSIRPVAVGSGEPEYITAEVKYFVTLPDREGNPTLVEITPSPEVIEKFNDERVSLPLPCQEWEVLPYKFQ